MNKNIVIAKKLIAIANKLIQANPEKQITENQKNHILVFLKEELDRSFSSYTNISDELNKIIQSNTPANVNTPTKIKPEIDQIDDMVWNSIIVRIKRDWASPTENLNIAHNNSDKFLKMLWDANTYINLLDATRTQIKKIISDTGGSIMQFNENINDWKRHDASVRSYYKSTKELYNQVVNVGESPQ